MRNQNTSGKGTRKTAPPVARAQSAYCPEVEARRAHYEQLAAAMLAMIELETGQVNPLLDIESEELEEPAHHLLINAIDGHLRLACDSVDWYRADSLKLYVEIRLLADQQAAERHADYEEAWREREGKQPVGSEN